MFFDATSEEGADVYWVLSDSTNGITYRGKAKISRPRWRDRLMLFMEGVRDGSPYIKRIFRDVSYMEVLESTMERP